MYVYIYIHLCVCVCVCVRACEYIYIYTGTNGVCPLQRVCRTPTSTASSAVAATRHAAALAPENKEGHVSHARLRANSQRRHPLPHVRRRHAIIVPPHPAPPSYMIVVSIRSTRGDTPSRVIDRNTT